jgi:hypothetical protein
MQVVRDGGGGGGVKNMMQSRGTSQVQDKNRKT